MSEHSTERKLIKSFEERGIPLRDLFRFVWLILVNVWTKLKISLMIAMTLHSCLVTVILLLDPSLYKQTHRMIMEILIGAPAFVFGVLALMEFVKSGNRRWHVWNKIWPILLVSLPIPSILMVFQPYFVNLTAEICYEIMVLLLATRGVVYLTHLIRYGVLNNVTILAICISLVVLVDGAVLMYSNEVGVNPEVGNLGDGFWMCFQAISGMGWNVPPVTSAGRWIAGSVWLIGFLTLASVISSSVGVVFQNFGKQKSAKEKNLQ